MAKEKPAKTVVTSFKMKLVLIFMPIILFFSLAELSTRAYVWYQFGRHNYGQRWTFEYEPYLTFRRAAIPDFPYPPKDDRFRILLLGGSTMYLTGVLPWMESFQEETGHEIEVINLAEKGYILSQEQIMLVLYGMKHKPDMVITLDGANDVVTTTKMGKPGIVYHSNFVRMGVEHPILNGFFGILKRSQFVNAVNKLNERRLERKVQLDDGASEETIEHMLQGWSNIATICKGMDIPYVIALQPFIHLRETRSEQEKALKVVKQYDFRAQWMSDFFTELSCRAQIQDFPGQTYFVDTTKAFNSIPKETSIFLDEVHITDEADFMLTDYIARSVVEAGFEIPREETEPTE